MDNRPVSTSVAPPEKATDIAMEANSAPEQPSTEKHKPWSIWTGKRIAYLSLAVGMVVVTIVLVVTLSVVLTRSGSRDDPSYHNEANRPRLVLGNFPDPGLIQVNNGTWFAYGTIAKINSTEVPQVPVAMSPDFTNWTKLAGYDALPKVGAWETDMNHYAPDVFQRDDGRFVLYYSGELKDWKQHHCVGTAISIDKSPLGPYQPHNTSLACPLHQGGAIDPAPFRDADGKLYVTYKVDANSVGNGGSCNNSKKPLVSVPILLQELEKDGITPVGDPIQILENNEHDDGPLVESPSLVRTADGIYYLFFSSHCFTSPKYNIKYATSSSLRGPYIRAKRPLLQSGDFGLSGPGGATISHDGTKMVFHANCEDVRCMYVAGIHINSTGPTVTLSGL